MTPQPDPTEPSKASRQQLRSVTTTDTDVRPHGFGRRRSRAVIVVAVRSPREVVGRGVVDMLRQHPHRVRVLDPDTPLVEADVTLCDVSGTDRVATGLDRIVTQSRSALVALTSTPSNSSAAAVLRRRVAGVVDMNVTSGDLVHIIETAHAIHTDGHLDALQGERPGPAPLGTQRLTPRQAEVLGLIARGLSNNQIAEEIFIAPNSVKTHIRACYRNIGVTTRTQAVAWYFTHVLNARVSDPVLVGVPTEAPTDQAAVLEA